MKIVCAIYIGVFSVACALTTDKASLQKAGDEGISANRLSYLTAPMFQSRVDEHALSDAERNPTPELKSLHEHLHPPKAIAGNRRLMTVSQSATVTILSDACLPGTSSNEAQTSEAVI